MKRKLLLLVFFGVFIWTQIVLHAYFENFQKKNNLDMKIENQFLDPVELIGLNILSSFRGLIVDVLWLRTVSPEVQENPEELALLYDLITSLQPNFVESASYAALNLGFDLSVVFETPEQQWFWISKALRLFDKSLKRNAQHPRVWKLYRNRSYLLAQKCLPTSTLARFSKQFAQFYQKEFGLDPYLAVIRDHRRLLDHPQMPNGLRFLYSRTFENWALSFEDPQKQLEKMSQARQAWQETIERYPQIADEQSAQILDMKIELCRSYLTWRNDSKQTNFHQWVNWVNNLAKLQWRDPLLEKQSRNILTQKGENIFVNALAQQAQRRFDRGKFLEVLDLCQTLNSIHRQKPLPGWPLAQARLSRLQAYSYDNIQGSLAFALQEGSQEERKRLIKSANSYKKKALEAFKRLLVFEPENSEVKEKINNLEKELNSP